MVKKIKKVDRYIYQLILFVLLIVSIVLLSSCEKDKTYKVNCKCGNVYHKENGQLHGYWIYQIRATNDCSGRDTIAEVTKDVYNASKVGENQCLNSSW